MLSVTTASVHHSMCPSTPTNTTPERKDRSWSFSSLTTNRRSRVRASSRKNLGLRLSTPVELNVEVSRHPVDEDLKTPDSKKPQQSSASTTKLRRHSVGLLSKNKSPSQRRYANQLCKEASSTAKDTGSLEKSEEQPEESDDKKATVENLERSTGENEAVPSTNGEQSFSSSSPLPGSGEKRKRRFESRISVALKMLKQDDNDVDYSISRPNLDSTIQDDTKETDDLMSLETTEEQIENMPQAHEPWTQDNWETPQEDNWQNPPNDNWQHQPQDNWQNPPQDNWENPPQDNWQNPPQDNWENWEDGHAAPPEPAFEDIPHYMTGFPNPPGENRCWLNATLQTLFALPLDDHLGRLNLNRCSMLTKTLVAMQLFWKSGAAEREKTYQTITRFKAQLEVLDESYSSQRQQDVSEFLMILLNHVKSDCEKLLKAPSDEAENVPDNAQNAESIVRPPSTTPTKRPPLTQISPFKRQNNANNNNSDRQVEESSPNKQSCEEPVRDQDQSLKNPIDDFFLLPMMEHYVCLSCEKHRQRNVDNLMLYVDLPGNETDSVDLADAISKTFEPEKRSLTCSKCKCNEHNVYTTFRQCPNVLIVQINRYGMTSDGYVAKMNSTVHIPEALRISATETQNGVDQVQQFVPVCSIAHVGGAMDCGHYTSYVKHGDQWFHYNDMSVAPMSSTEALSAVETTAYLVFFVNVNFLPKSPGFTEDTTEEEVSR